MTILSPFSNHAFIHLLQIKFAVIKVQIIQLKKITLYKSIEHILAKLQLVKLLICQYASNSANLSIC